MRTCQSIAERERAVIARIARAGQMLNTRIELVTQAINADLLHSMDKRTLAQLRLQRTVEGLSVVAISYYAVALLGFPIAALTKLRRRSSDAHRGRARAHRRADRLAFPRAHSARARSGGNEGRTTALKRQPDRASARCRPTSSPCDGQADAAIATQATRGRFSRTLRTAILASPQPAPATKCALPRVARAIPAAAVEAIAISVMASTASLSGAGVQHLDSARFRIGGARQHKPSGSVPIGSRTLRLSSSG
jgi:hypothetical protein